jgi:hypothetical protein
MDPVIPPVAPEIIQDKRIVLSLPCYGGKIDQPFMQCVLHTLGTIQLIPFIDFMPGDSLVNRARNNLAHNFLNGFPEQTPEGKPALRLFEWLLFIDTDLIFQPESIAKLYDLGCQKGPGIYAGTYPIKQLRPKVVFNNMPGCFPDAEGIVEVREAGTGFMLIHREVFTRMIEKFSDEMRFETDMGDITGPRTIKYDFFTVGVRLDPLLGYRRFLSEDWYFCQRWREMGGKIWMHTGIQCGHIGNFVFPGNPQEIIDTAEHLKKSFALAASPPKPLVVKVGPPEHFTPKAEPVPIAVAV